MKMMNPTILGINLYNFQNGKSLSSVRYVVYFFKSLLTFKAMLSFSEPDNELTTYADKLTEI